MADIQTPDSIGALPRSRTELVPGAKSLSVYQGGTRNDVAEPAQTNSYSQLGAALSTFAGSTGVELTKAAATAKAEDDLIAGQAASDQMQKRNIRSLSEAAAKGIIPAGANPAFLQATREQNLMYVADKRRLSLATAYASPEAASVRDSSDPAVFNAFVQKHDATFDKAYLLDAGGAPIYSDLDFHRAQYGPKAAHATNQLYGQHLSYRISENEKAAEETAGLRTSQAIADGLDYGHSHAQIAANIGAIYRDPQTGLVTHGMDASKQTQMTVDSIVAAAVERKDASVLDILSVSKTNGNSTLAGTTPAKKAVQPARQLIANLVWQEQERNRVQAERRGAGVGTFPEAEARAKEIRDRSEQEYMVKVKQLSHQGITLDKAVQAEPEQAAIMKHLANGSSAFDEEVIGHLKNLTAIDHVAGQQMMTFVQTQQAKQKSAVDESSTLHTYTRLRADLSNDPSKFDRGRIVQEANQGHLTAGQVSSLYENAESAAKAHAEFPVLQSDLIKTMRTDIRAASMTSQLDEFGSGRLRADAATNEFNDIVLDFVKTHPTAGAYEISKAMRPELERLSRRHNPELDQTMTQTESKAANEQLHQEQAQAKAQREADFANPRANNDPLRAAIRKEFADRYPNQSQLNDVVETVYAHRHKGKK